MVNHVQEATQTRRAPWKDARPIKTDRQEMNVQTRQRRIALFWDESFLWGAMAHRALIDAGLPFRLVGAGEIRNGALQGFPAVLVPGGWASNKLKALGEIGIDRIRQFVDSGGTYIGFCGGAGLATGDGLGLVNAKRVPTAQRVPSFSGRIRLTLKPHSLWARVDDPIFHVWWPSQLATGEDVTVLARYAQALPDAFSSDLNVGDVSAAGGWAEWEASYGINLDPSRLVGLPAVITGKYGRGNVFLSLVHFDTPGDSNGTTVLQNLWAVIEGTRSSSGIEQGKMAADKTPSIPLSEIYPSVEGLVTELSGVVDDLIEFGIRNFLWFKREPSMLQWRRGVRGLEFHTLKVMVDEIRKFIPVDDPRSSTSLIEKPSQQVDRVAITVEKRLRNIGNALTPFANEAKRLLILERQAMMTERLTFAESTDSRILNLRRLLFSTTKSHGGLFKEVVDQMSALLHSLITTTRF
jgi:hypothetical protein